ncbi:MAG: DUF6088 family protein [Bacteroidota bacterium]
MPIIHKHIENELTRLKAGELIFASDFRTAGTGGAIKMALSRLNKEGKIKRLAHGIYIKPKTDPLFGFIYPSPETIAETIAEKEKLKITPAGPYALHRLGLSTQVPTQFTYLTNGTPRQIRVGKAIIKFKTTNPKRLERVGKISSLVIQALEELDIKKIDADTAYKLKALLLQEDPAKLNHDLKITTTRVSDFIFTLLKGTYDDRLVTTNKRTKKD